MDSPACQNEAGGLELPGFGEWPGSSRYSGCPGGPRCFVSDTRWMEWFRWKLNMKNMVVKNSVRASGGLALFWKKEVDLKVLSLSKYHIDAIIKEADGCCWRFTGFYGESEK